MLSLIEGQRESLPENGQKMKDTKVSAFMALNGFFKCIAGAIITCGLLVAVSPLARAQDMSTGALNVTVQDPTGAVVNGAQLVLTDLETNDVHKATTKGAGSVVLSFLNPAHYNLTVTKEGFSIKVYPSVAIQTNQVTDLKVMLELGAATQSVTVSGETSSLLDTTQNALSMTLDLKQVDDLPMAGRDTMALAYLVPGAVGNNFNNLPGGAVNVSANGFSTMTNRNKSGGFDTDGSSITNRLEDVQEMTVQTGELDASKGGTSVMDVGFLTKRGTNKFHGQLYEDYRSGGLNANSWYNKNVKLKRSSLVKNDFGASVGGPILKDKLFFFVSLANYRQPYNYTTSSEIGTAAALAGNYSFYPTGSSTAQTVNVLTAGASTTGCSTCTGTINTLIATDLANIESTYSLDNATQSFVDINHNNLNFPVKENIVDKYPTIRLDYNLTSNFRLTGSASQTTQQYTDAGAPPFPGPHFSNQAYSNFYKNYQVVAGFDWDIKPSLVNAFRAGYLYTGRTYNSQGMGVPTADMMEQGDLTFGFNLNSGINYFNALKGGYLYPVLSVKDDFIWQRGRHSLTFGVESATEIDHYYNNQFVPYIGVDSITSGDPVQNALDNSLPSNAPSSAAGDVEGLYSTLTGRMTYYSRGEFINAKTKKYEQGISFNLHEKLNQTALFIEDAWKAKPTLTLNVGLRWDFTGASKDETGFYTHPTLANLWGPTAVGDIFKPGVLNGVSNPVQVPASEAYDPTYMHPEPNVGIAWNPQGAPDTLLGKFLGNGATVIRASYTFKNYTEGAQNFWNFGSNNGLNFNNWYYANAITPTSSTPGAGYYNAGTVSLGGALPALTTSSPDPFQADIYESTEAFSGTSFLTFDPHIQQPYVESWQVGIQRSLSQNNVLEVRYVGNVAKKQWMAVNYNEVNIFENGFLKDFQAAQANYAASPANAKTLKGAQPTPILDQVFASTGGAGFTDGGFLTDVKQGQAGAFASTIAGSPSYLCSMVTGFDSECEAATGAGSTGSYPINFFQANPYATGNGIMEMTNAGFSNYNSLQVDFRQRLNHGMQFDANYTWAHSLGTSVQGSTAPGYYSGGGNGGGGNGSAGNSAPGFYTLRNKHLNYFPSSFDIRQVFHLIGTYDLPFGHKQPFFNQNRVANAAIGGWTIGAILTYQTGDPHLLTGGTYTVNGNDSGVTLTGVTASQLQKQMKIRPGTAGSGRVNLFDSKYYASGGRSNTTYIGPNYNAGQFGSLLWLHDPKWINTNMSINKVVPIRGEMNFTLQAEFLNVFNHPAFTGMDTGVQDTTFGTTSTTVNSPRNIELRGNFRF
jgi:hypothetical protein